MLQVAENLRLWILELYEGHLAEDGSSVDYKGIRSDPAFADYVDATAELQQVNLAAMSEPERKVKISAHGSQTNSSTQRSTSGAAASAVQREPHFLRLQTEWVTVHRIRTSP